MDRATGVETRWRSGLPETPCGKGSRLENTERIREYLPDLLRDYNIRTMADVGCGDRNWIKTLDLPPGFTYGNYDIAPLKPEVMFFDARIQILPPVDLVLCIYMLNHLRPRDTQRALKNFQLSGSKYLLASHAVPSLYDVPFDWVEGTHHKTTKRHDWSYMLWRMNE